MCYGFSTATAGFPGASLERFVAAQTSRKASASPDVNFKVVEFSTSFAADSAAFLPQEAGDKGTRPPCVEGEEVYDDGKKIAEMRMDPKKVSNYR